MTFVNVMFFFYVLWLKCHKSGEVESEGQGHGRNFIFLGGWENLWRPLDSTRCTTHENSLGFMSFCLFLNLFNGDRNDFGFSLSKQ